jgi:hypothetical protein
VIRQYGLLAVVVVLVLLGVLALVEVLHFGFSFSVGK